MNIEDIRAMEVLDSRGNPTLYAEVSVKGIRAGAMVPSGASTGSGEALELRDAEPGRYAGKGVSRAVANVNTSLRELLCGSDVRAQYDIDQRMCDLDATADKSHLGANAILAVSLACAHAGADACGIPLYRYLMDLYQQRYRPRPEILPLPMMNVLNGGMHADNRLEVQEFMLLPQGFNSFAEALRAGAEVFHSLRGVLLESRMSTGVGDEGGFAPDLASSAEALDMLMRAIDDAGYRPGEDIALAMDCAATEFHSDGYYHLEGRKLETEELCDYLHQLLQKYPIRSVEDGMDEADNLGWKLMTERLGGAVQLVGDDLFVTDAERLKQGIAGGLANAILIKPNQIGTLSETFKTIALAADADYGIVISHRSGETEDTTIADLAVAVGAGQIKTGSLSRSERVAKYNRLLMIERMDDFDYAAGRYMRGPG